MSSERDVLGIGNALLDVVCHVDDAFLEEEGLSKGAMTLIDAGRAESLYAMMKTRVEVSGGSVANTMAGLASLGGRGVYLGKVKDDVVGRTFQRDIRASGVDFDVPLAASGPPTGRCMVFVTPDAQRTMQTYLGASATFCPDDVDADAIRSALITYLEGYLFDPEPAKQAFFKAAEIAHQAGRKVALSLSDPFCVDRHRTAFRELVAGHVDILFANEDEVVSLYEADDFPAALPQLQEQCELAAVTLGEKGSAVVAGDRMVQVAAQRVPQVVDTTGAGDLFASGFLFGLIRGVAAEECGRLGSLVAAEIISHYGARPETPLRDLVQGATVT
jgi:sugar/nucleoside kinase (ribokinase family)